ncbi:ferritin-like domain-containing protein [Pyxidicoccus fallax]|uniref:Ferritin-like domain-containing protein n=1 Tax=Pyxidicoccus fallax TaxID=394095 RepID=A0A848LHY7_9BACT|nr:ferritin-like domain-containing protein [Pyxidicoccus fallax]NMO16758.1 ferritin-like domain-containing protein [Pyxidicoccus fallax]NPC77849.1 ferritin-like domain-containing protein [Pyxidicoccus fallax]
MSRSKVSLLPANPLLRHTVSRLLVAVPLLTLVGCGSGEEEGPCFSRQTPFTESFTGATLADGGVPQQEDCMALCEVKKSYGTIESCNVRVVPASDAGTGATVSVLDCRGFYETCSDGRKPEGLQEPRLDAHCSLGALFARMAWLEAASVPAFLRLARELKAHGAPEVLVRAARRSAGEEVRHTRAMTALARRHGASAPEVELAPFPTRSLEDMLVENAKEGCVRETFGAVVAGWQARAAEDARVREEFERIAEDELRHAELAWAVDAWAAELLTPEARQRVRDARREAFEELKHLLARQEPDATLVRQAGIPSRDAALQLLGGLEVLVA